MLLEQAERQSKTMRVVRGRGPLLTCLAEAYLAAGERLQETMARANDLEMRPLVAHCRAALGRLHLRAGEREDAQRYLTGAATLFRQLGMTFWLDELEATLAGLR